jgi:hypothetical protein
MGLTPNYSMDYGVRGQNPYWNIWEGLWLKVDTELYTRSKDLLMNEYYIRNVGRLGVGISSPEGFIHIMASDTSKASPFVPALLLEDSNPLMEFQTNIADANFLLQAVGGPPSFFRIASYTDAGVVTPIIVATLDTKVGIGMSPQYTFDVAGIIRAYGDNIVVGYNASTEGGFFLTKTSTYGKPSIQGVTAAFAVEDIMLNPMGGLIWLGTYSAKDAEAFAGYITIKDLTGASRKLMVCA